MGHPRLYPQWEPAILARLFWLSISPDVFILGGYNEPTSVGLLPPVFRLSSVQPSKGPKAATAQPRSLCQCWQEEESVRIWVSHSPVLLREALVSCSYESGIARLCSERPEKRAGVLVTCSSHGKLTLRMHFALGNFAVFCSSWYFG